jgi:hypothetical protein
MDTVLLLMMTYAAFGLVVSFFVHLLSILGLGRTALFTVIDIGIVPLVTAAALIYGSEMSGDRGRGRDFWQVMLSGCPQWIKYMTYGLLIYAFANFALTFIFSSTAVAVMINGHRSWSPAIMARLFSGHWMLFYSAGLAILTSAYRRGLSNRAANE